MNVPDVCHECYTRVLDMAGRIYIDKLTYEGNSLLNKAKNEWMANQTIEGANKAAEYLDQIDPMSPTLKEASDFQNTITAKLKEDERRAWQLKMKKIETKRQIALARISTAKQVAIARLVANKEKAIKDMEEDGKTARAMIDCIKEVGIVWGQRQPTTSVRNTINKWNKF